ncbi:RlpA-like double-psi beta-barrel-protein domain-containing protein-containing protein [Triangularia verruculosa]|uniref:RlpA-like double-psi beta-barrel-protein domain-containing protein-containing protein n=1 Tax=Triangularia verruculosa TaxID=2587418 RepID=A0AAN6XE24_9PEZI|nr:RlpA-like double-psi beta-barrel-protein domain-containing protein-containing protein [Triangularia verruculosa]
MYFSTTTLTTTLLTLLTLTSAAPTTPNQGSPLEVEAREIVARARGEFTWYNTGLGACGKVNNDGQLVAALNRVLFDPQTPNGNPNNNPLCGRKIRASYNGKTVDVTVVDRCPGCKAGDLDLSPAAFQRLAPLSAGRITGDWSWL